MSSRAGRWLWSGAAIGGIWACVAAMALWSPDLISGSQQEHLPLAAITGWIWALLATGLVAMAPASTSNDRGPMWVAYAVTLAAVWVVAAVVSIAAPPFVTGTDPTSIPLAALLAPIVAFVITAYATVAVVAVGAREASIGSAIDSVVRQIREPSARSIS